MEPLFACRGVRRADTYLAALRLTYRHSTVFAFRVILCSMFGLPIVLFGTIRWINGSFLSPVKCGAFFAALLGMGLLAVYILFIQPKMRWSRALETSKALVGAAYSFALYPGEVVSHTAFEEVRIPYEDLKEIFESDRLVIFQAEQFFMVMEKSELTVGKPEYLSAFLRSLPCRYNYWKGGRRGG